jgi:hypothetical protein
MTAEDASGFGFTGTVIKGGVKSTESWPGNELDFIDFHCDTHELPNCAL